MGFGGMRVVMRFELLALMVAEVVLKLRVEAPCENLGARAT